LGEDVTIRELAELICEVAGYGGRIAWLAQTYLGSWKVTMRKLQIEDVEVMRIALQQKIARTRNRVMAAGHVPADRRTVWREWYDGAVLGGWHAIQLYEAPSVHNLGVHYTGIDSLSLGLIPRPGQHCHRVGVITTAVAGVVLANSGPIVS